MERGGPPLAPDGSLAYAERACSFSGLHHSHFSVLPDQPIRRISSFIHS